jgi:2-keto-4-pentenoate hydratase/2-oxohepta-3-ene-1,7-dioic acid hydratase in catechol pathway
MGKIICIGRNYADHAKELGNETPKEPVIFMKPDSAILQKGMPFFIPSFSQNIQYECELIVRINRLGKRIEPQFAHKYYKEIGLGIDFTARDVQTRLKEQRLPWEIAKGFDGSAVIGKWFNKKEFNLNDLAFTLHKNETLVQQGNTKDMIFNLDHLISHISQYFTLKIGDIIYTGTPAGVGKVEVNDVLTGHINNQLAFEIKCK